MGNHTPLAYSHLQASLTNLCRLHESDLQRTVVAEVTMALKTYTKGVEADTAAHVMHMLDSRLTALPEGKDRQVIEGFMQKARAEIKGVYRKL